MSAHSAWYVVEPPRPRRRRVVAPFGIIAGLGLATAAIAVRDPHVAGSWGLCPSAALGFWCPGCGGLRGVHDLTHGDLVAAASSNLLLVVLGPVAVFLLGRWALDAWRGRYRERHPQRERLIATVILGIVIGFTVVRNLPAGAWLAP